MAYDAAVDELVADADGDATDEVRVDNHLQKYLVADGRVVLSIVPRRRTGLAIPDSVPANVI